MCSTQSGKSKYYCLLCTCVCESNMASQNGTPIDKFSETNALQSPVLWSFFSLCVNFDIIIKKVKVHFEVLTFRTTLITCLWPNFIPFFLDFDPRYLSMSNIIVLEVGRDATIWITVISSLPKQEVLIIMKPDNFSPFV